MSTIGTFTINLAPQTQDQPAAGRMIIDKEYTGAIVGKGLGQMISKRTESGSAVYSAIEEFEGTIDGKKGCLTFFHIGEMSATKQSLNVSIVAGSGSEELAGIEGKLTITQEQGSHQYQLEYTL